jgi:hypothetical protein
MRNIRISSIAKRVAGDINHQYFSDKDDGPQWKISEILEFIHNTGINYSPIDIKMLDKMTKNTELDEERGSEAFKKRRDAADLSYPIIVVRYPDGSMLIADGNHRLAKAKHEKYDKINGYIVERSDLDLLNTY